jgi:RNA polymerase sigma-70 factor (ECF subfamily)
VENENNRFEEAILPHLDAAYNLARWLTGNEQDARDMAQESLLRAFRFFGNFRGGNPRAWLLTIVRNTVYTWFKQRQAHDRVLQADEAMEEFEDVAVNPAVLLERTANIELVRDAIAQLPTEFREAIVLREMENLSYKEIADIAGVRIGTVMSRIARGRRQLQIILTQGQNISAGRPS